ncbi:MAG: MFS transporter, partial [Bacillus mycoides]
SLVTVFCIAMALILLAIGPVLRMQIKKEDIVNREEMTN